MKHIPYGRQYIDIKDINAVSSVLKKDIITSGNQVLIFEKKLNKYLKCKYSSVCNSGTSAIFLALSAINLKENDVIIMPALNFIAFYNMASFFKVKIHFADVDDKTGQITPESILECIKKNNLNKIKAIIIMYNGGYPENVKGFFEIKKKFNCLIVEDACHALGSKYVINKKKFKIGSCNHCDISTFSLHPLKTITTGEGGIVTTNSKKFDHKIKLIRSHGIKRTKDHWNYDVLTPGFNFRLNDFQSSLGISQLQRIEKFIEKRKKVSNLYNKYLKKIDEIDLIDYKNRNFSSFHLYIVHLKKNKKKFLRYMLKKKIMAQYHYIPVYKFSFFKKNVKLKKTENYYKSAISLPIYYDLNIKTQMYIIKSIYQFFKKKFIKI